MQVRSFTFVLSLLTLPALARAQNAYVLDDGTAESAIGFSGQVVDYAWMQVFDAVGGADSIRSVEVRVGGTWPAGTPITVAVWDDVSDVSDPDAWQLRGSTTGVVSTSGPGGFATYTLATPAAVQNRFVVGAVITSDGFNSPALLDHGSGLSGRAFFSWNYTPGGFDLAHLSNNFPPTHVEILGAGIHGVFLLRAHGDATQVYCTAKTNSLGCVPRIAFAGSASASAGSGFVVSASNLKNQQNGLFFYGTSGRAAVPFLGGTLCVAAPLRRTVIQNSGGSTSGTNCTGSYAFDFNVWIAGAHDPLLAPGTMVQGQYFARDPGFPAPNNVSLTDAVEFTIQP